MVHLLFFCSGFAALIYQVAWVRAFGNLFGNTVYSAAIVTAVFMLGLGAGAYVAGRWVDRRYAVRPDSLLRVFGVVELAIGAMAAAVPLALPRLAALTASLSSYDQGLDGWYTLSAGSHLLKALLTAAVLAPITLLMGSTLTLLVRHVVARDIQAAGWRIARLYAVNTAGAAAGCFLTDFALVPHYGLQRAQMVAFAINAGTAVVAFAWAPLASARSDAPRRAPAPSAVVAARSGSPLPWAAIAIGLSGFAAMGMEILWFRYFTILLGEYRAVFSLLLTVILAGIGVGSLCGGWIHRRTASTATLWIVAQTLFIACAMGGLLAVDARAIRDAAAEAPTLDGWARLWAEVLFNGVPIATVVAVPSLLMGVAFPLANAFVQRLEDRVGHRAGVLYLANTAGAVAGSLVTGFLLLPGAGVQGTATILAAVAALVIPAVHAAARVESPVERPQPRTRTAARTEEPAVPRRWAAAGVLVSAGAIVWWALLPPNFLLGRLVLFPLDKTYAVSEGLTEVVAVTDGPDGGRILVTNGHPMSSTELFSQRYMRGMAHIPLLSMDRPSRVLVLCYGVGNTTHAASLHPSIQRIDVVDLSAHVLRHSEYFTDVNRDVLSNPRVAIYVNDGRNHLAMPEAGPYDLITLEPPPIVHAGVASLYSVEFYRSARERLAPNGSLSQWLPVFGVSNSIVRSMVRAFVDVFPNAVLLSGAGTNLLLVGTRGETNQIDPERIAASLAGAPAVREDLARLELGTVSEIVGTFVAPPRTLIEATRAVLPVTDDRPLQEYGRRSLIDFGEGGIPPDLIAVSELTSWCPGCMSNGRPVRRVAGLDTYLRLTELAYRAPPGAATQATRGGRTVAGSGYLGVIVPESAEVNRVLAAAAARPAATATDGEEIAAVRQAAENDPGNGPARYAFATALLEAGRFTEAAEELQAAIRLMPESPEAHNNLGVALASLGRLGEALVQFEHALALRPDFEDAQRNAAFARTALEPR